MYKTYVKGQGWVTTLTPMWEEDVVAQQKLVADVAECSELDEVQWYEEDEARNLIKDK
jgi:hypothetical protein